MKDKDLKAKDFNAALPVMRELVWADRVQREKLQGNGITVIPSNFYSNIPSISEIAGSYEYEEPTAPYLECGIFNQDDLRDELSALIPFSEDFDPPKSDNEETCRSYFWENSQFSYSDAMSYYAYVRRIRPKAIVEIVSGFSSLVALDALRQNETGKLKSIEPYPRSFIEGLNDEGALELHKIRAQDVTADELNSMLDDGDILFIDSTHTVKSGSDCLHIYLRLLPRIKKKIFVHVHDIFLPFGMPKNWLLHNHIYWTEQYLLLALLIDNPKIRVLFGSAYHGHFNAELLARFMHGRFAGGGGSFWFEYDG